MRESASPSEGGKGPLGGGTRQYGALEAVLRLLIFGRCAENAGKLHTSGRWDETVPLWQRVTDLRKVGCSGVKRRHGHRRVSQRAYRKVNTYVIVPSWTAGAEAETLNLALRAAFLAASQRVAS